MNECQCGSPDGHCFLSLTGKAEEWEKIDKEIESGREELFSKRGWGRGRLHQKDEKED